MALKVDEKTQILLRQKITKFFSKFNVYTVVEQHQEYNKTKTLGFAAQTIANIQHGNSVRKKTIITVMEKLGLVYDNDYFLNHGIIKHLENEA